MKSQLNVLPILHEIPHLCKMGHRFFLRICRFSGLFLDKKKEFLVFFVIFAKPFVRPFHFRHDVSAIVELQKLTEFPHRMDRVHQLFCRGASSGTVREKDPWRVRFRQKFSDRFHCKKTPGLRISSEFFKNGSGSENS